jgi:hypothetical protein
MRRFVYLALAGATVASVLLIAFVAGRLAHDHTRTGDAPVVDTYERVASRCLANGGTSRACNQYEPCMADPHWARTSDGLSVASSRCDESKINLTEVPARAPDR